MSRSEELFARATKVIPGGVNSPVRAFRAVGGTPPFIVRGEGAYVQDADGRRLLDHIQSWGALLFGHAREEIVRAATEAARKGTSFGLPTEAELELAERIGELVPSIASVRLVSSGTEAVMTAVRLARAATGRSVIVKFDGCYHGHSDALMGRAGSGLATLGLSGTAGVPPADTVSVAFNDLGAVVSVFEEAPRRVAAVIVEPVAANMGVVAPDQGFLPGLRTLCHANGALLIFDEVITGFRLAPGGAQHLLDVAPDLTCLGKILGGGFPCAAVGGRREVMEQLAPEGPVYQAGTLSGNPVAVAAGLAALALIQKEDPYPALRGRAERLAAGLAERFEREGVTATVNRVESLLSVFFTARPVRDHAGARMADHRRYARFFHAMLEEGVLLPPSGFEAWFLSTAHGDGEIERTLDAAGRACATLAGEEPRKG